MLNTKNKNKGQVLILVVFALVAFFGFAALAIDVAYFYHTKHQLQGAADAAALAGAAKLNCLQSNNLLQSDARGEAILFAGKNIAAKLSVVPASPENGTIEDNILSATNDITVGFWDGLRYTAGVTPVNAVLVRARRTETAEDSPRRQIKTFFGGIFNVTWVNISATAVARGCFPNITPVAVNEYWMGEGAGYGGADCNLLRKPNLGKLPYGGEHLYPNSFVRPPCNDYLYADNVADNKCIFPSPSNGNVDPFPTLSCDRPGPVGPEVVTISPNGPLSADCSGDACKGRPGLRTGRVFAITGANADPNSGDMNLNSLVDLDHRIGCSETTGCTEQQWYKVSGWQFTAADPNKADPNPDKEIVARYIRDGRYPNVAPVSVDEVYQIGYIDRTPYVEGSPYASISYPSGLGVWGNMVRNNFYPYERYAIGNKINVMVYDGIVGGGGNQQRTTIVGFARIKIFGYGTGLSVDGPDPDDDPDLINPNNQQTLYGYVENEADSLKQTIEELDIPFVPGAAALVQ